MEFVLLLLVFRFLISCFLLFGVSFFLKKSGLWFGLPPAPFWSLELQNIPLRFRTSLTVPEGGAPRERNAEIWKMHTFQKDFATED